MADQKINELPTKTAPSTGDKMLMIGAAEEYQIDYDQLATAILNKLSTQSFSSLDTTSKTVLGAIDELNSKTLGNIAYYDANTDHTSETARSQALIKVLNQLKKNNTNTYLVSVIRYYNGYYFTYVASIQSGGSSFYVLEYSASMSAINIWNVTRTLNSATITRRFSDDATLFTGTAIQSGDDLNDYTTPGIYYSPASAVSGTLINIPDESAKTSGFSLLVLPISVSGSGGRVSQTIIRGSEASTIYTRSESSSGWRWWYKYAGEKLPD